MRILKFIGYLFIFISIPYFSLANELIGTIGIVVGQAEVVNRNIEIKIKENIYFGDVIQTSAQTNLQILFDDETVFTIGENTKIVINEFIYDPNQNDELNTISAELLEGSLKVVTGLISKNNPENLSITLPTGVLATRGTEVQALVKPGQNDIVVLLGPGPNNVAGERAGAIEVSNNQGSVYMDQQFSFTSITLNQAPTPPQPAPIALIQEINQSLSAGTTALVNVDSEMLDEDVPAEDEDVPTEDVASNEETVQEESSDTETLISISTKAVNDEVKSAIVEEFNSEEGLLKASIPKVMTIVANSRKRNTSMTESESVMLNNVNNMMNAKLSLVNLVTDDNFMDEFNTYLASYELTNVPQLKVKIRQTERAVSKAGKAEDVAEKKIDKATQSKEEAKTASQKSNQASKTAKQAVNKANQAKQAATKEKALAKEEGRAVNKKIINKAKTLTKKATKAKQKAKVAAKQATKAKKKAKVSAKQATKAKQKAKAAAKTAAKKVAQAAKKAAQLAAAKSFVIATNVASTWKEINTKTSGSYTYDANNISLTATVGSGSGSVDAASTINFASRTIAVTYVGTDIQLGASGTTRDFSTTRTRNYSSSNTDYVDGSGYMQETYNFNIKNNGNTNRNKIKQRGSDTLQSLTDLTKRDVDDNWCAKSVCGSNEWYFVNTDFQANNGSTTNDLASTGTFSISVENFDSDSGSGGIKNQITGSKTVAKD